MQTALRKMGNSVGMIVPKAILQELGASAGTRLDVRVVDGAAIVTPLRHPREGWAEAAALIGAEPLTDEEKDWLAFEDDDGEWVWDEPGAEQR